MNTFTVTTFINRPQQAVFDFVSDPSNASQWQSGTKSAGWISAGPVKVGSVFQQVIKLFGRETKVDVEITHWDIPNKWAAKTSNGPLKIETTTMFETQDGGTNLSISMQGEVGGFFNMAEGLTFKQMQKQTETDSKTLKTLLESM